MSTARPPLSPSTPLLSLDQVAEVLGCTYEQVRRLVRERGLPVIHLGKYRRVDVRDLDTWLDGQRVAR